MQIVDGETGRLVGTVDAASADSTVHTGAVYVHQGEVYVVDANGGTARRLTNDPAEDDVIKWSPDGSRIAFRAHRTAPNNSDIEIVDVEYAPIPMDPFHEPPGAEAARRPSEGVSRT